MFGLFDEAFDFNHDGKLDCFENATEFATMMSIFDEEEKENRRKQNFWDDSESDDYDDSF